MKTFNVIRWNINTGKFVPYNILPYLEKCYHEADNKPKTFEEFKTFIEKRSRYQWWARCEHEIILKDWPNGRVEKKIDVFDQVMMNIDVITKILMDEMP